MEKKTRNANGRGTIYKENDLWVVQISYKDEDGHVKRKKFKGKVKRLAHEKANAFLDDLNKGLSPTADKVTIGYWCEEWLNEFTKQRVRPRTWEKYKSCFDCYILPRFQTVLLKDLTARDVQRHFNKLLVDGRKDGKGVSSSTVRGTRRYFTMCIDAAIKQGLLIKNVVKDTEPPKLKKKDIIVLNESQIKMLINEACLIQNEFMQCIMPVILQLALHTGMRQGEIFGLKWEDIHLAENCLYIQHSLAYIVGVGSVLQEPKTKSSKRKILLMQADVNMLEDYAVWQKEQINLLCNQYKDQGLVFPNTFGNPLDTSNFVTRYFKPLLKPAGIDSNFTFHGLRHTHATLLLQQGVNPKVIQERLGHSCIAVTIDVYSHLLPDMQDKAIDALNQIFK